MSISSNKHDTLTDNPSIMIYVNKIENKITFKIKTGCYLELLTLEMMKLLGSTKSKITKDKNNENVPHLNITEVVSIHCNIVNNSYQPDSRVLCTFVPNKSFFPNKSIFTYFNQEFYTLKSFQVSIFIY